MFLEKLIGLYPQLVAITAVVLYIRHRIMPYDYREKFPYDNPPPKFFGSFSLGEFIQYVIQVVSFPIILLTMVGLELGRNTKSDIPFVILLVLWWFIPKALARKIDGW